MDFGTLNVLSLALGLASWALPIIAIFYLKKKNYKRVRNLSILSVSLTVVSMYFQFLYINHLVKIGDWIAIEDTNGGVVFCCTALIFVTFSLNFINLLIMKFNKNK
ncbi:hypothetical protein [uncultured Tyzzerella sp.]|uniref:hypothetical protein n=1 Tax=uncultured Tyzzerella sp. TaxID=2321398 RepID=UPI0029435A3A|nr:hypothetical protein [uncultured Tyzzerella sp.]